MKIEYPDRTAHAEMQATLWSLLVQAQIDARLEVKASKSRLDIVLFKDREARGIIECKSWSKSYIRAQKWQKYKNSKQLTKYKESFGIPVFVCGCQASIKPALDFATKCVKW